MSYDENNHPKCFTCTQWAEWLDIEPVFRPYTLEGQLFPCADCVPAYQARMIKENKCEHPEVVFALDRDGFPTGKMP